MKFIRRDFKRFSKIGKNRKKLQKWRKPKGMDNKMREKRFGYPKCPGVGYKSSRKDSGKIDGLVPIRVLNVKGLEKVGKENLVIVGKVGAKKKMEIIKKATKKKLRILNLGKGVKTNATK